MESIKSIKQNLTCLNGTVSTEQWWQKNENWLKN